MTESHFVRKTTKCPLLGCCPKTEYAFISPEGAKHTARRFKTSACAACLGRICCKPTIDQTKFTSDAVSALPFPSAVCDVVWLLLLLLVLH